ncbi:MAG: PBSX family phage terminase large subunit [Clostridia bacterium]|nr:PBSX family phage terminase large subunit [Clostridia bacterium]
MTTSEIKLSELIGGGYDEFWNCEKRYRVLKGGKGSKKSCTTAINLLFRLMKLPGSNLLVVRQVMNTHRDSTFAQLKWAQEKLQVSHLWKNTVSPMEMEYLPTGQKILFRGFDDVLKLASATVPHGHLNFVWIEEAFELPSEADFDKLDLSVPRGIVKPPLYKQTTLTFNPWSATHWLKKRFFDTPSEQVATFSTNYLINEFLDETDRTVFERMKRSNRRKYEVAGLGNWGIAEGLVYENWAVGKKEIPKEEAYKWKTFFGLDYGYTNDPTGFVAFLANPVDRELYIVDEFCKTRMLNSDIANEIKRRGYAKERIRADCAEPKSNDDLRRMGIARITPSVKGRDSILNGIAAISEYAITVHPSCVNMIRELSTYAYAQKTAEGGFQMPKDSDNHLCDAMRYAFEDVKFFHPTPQGEKEPSPLPELTGSDFSGGWII